MIVLWADRPNIAPVNDPIGAVVWGMDTSNVAWALVGGTLLVEHGELTADVARARALATAAQQHVIAGAGLLVNAGATTRMTTDATRRPFLTRFVVASRYLPVYIALILLVVVASIWVPERSAGWRCRRSHRSLPCWRSPHSGRCW